MLIVVYGVNVLLNIALFVCRVLSNMFVDTVNFFALYSNHHLIRC